MSSCTSVGRRAWRARAVALLLSTAVVLVISGSAESSGEPSGTWGSSGEGQPSLTLAEDGGLSGTDGCNRLTGSWAEDEGTVTFEGVATTLKACADVDTWLSALDTATIDGDTMHVRDQSGDEIGTLARG